MSRRIIATTLLALCLAAALSAQFASAALRAHTTTQGSSTNPDGTSGPPQNTVAPTLTPTTAVKVGTTLTCNPGLWADDPTYFRYRWTRNAKAIRGAGAATYRTVTADAGTRLACQVSGHNIQGYGPTVTTPSVKVAGTAAPRCPAAGGLGAGSAGPFTLGATLAALKQRDAHVSAKAGFQDFCVAGGPIVRVGLPSAKLLKRLSASTRRAVSGRAVFLLSANRAYRLSGVTPGAKLTTALSRTLHLGRAIVIGANRWYVLAHSSTAVGLLQVRGGTVAGVGLLSKRLSGSAARDRTVLASFS